MRRFARWKAVETREAELLRATPDAVRFRQLQALWSAVEEANLPVATPEDIAEVRALESVEEKIS